MAAAQVLDERMTSGQDTRGAVPLQAPHRPQPGFQPPVICLDRVSCVPPDGVQRGGDQLIEHPGISGRPVGGDLGRDRASAKRPGEEPPGGGQVPPGRQQDVDDLAMLIRRPVQVSPPAGDLHVRLIGEPAVTGSVAARPGGLDELRGEPLHPPVDGDVIHG